MDAIRLGLQLRALRIRRGWRQLDVAVRAGVSRSLVGAMERGEIGRIQVDTILAVATALDARLDLVLRWHGEALDRLLDAAHARLVDAVVRVLRAAAWDVRVEVSFAFGGERGSIDVLAFHAATGRLLVIEVKSVVPDIQALLHGVDRKARIAVRLGRDMGWSVRGPVAPLVVLPESTTSRRRLAAHAATFDVALPDRGVAVRRWIRKPTGPLAGMMFLPDDAVGGTRRPTTGVTRVNPARNARSDRLTPPGASPGDQSSAKVARGGIR